MVVGFLKGSADMTTVSEYDCGALYCVKGTLLVYPSNTSCLLSHRTVEP